MTKGYYVITELEEIWCESKAGAKQTQRDFGGEIVSAEEYENTLLTKQFFPWIKDFECSK